MQRGAVYVDDGRLLALCACLALHLEELPEEKRVDAHALHGTEEARREGSATNTARLRRAHRLRRCGQLHHLCHGECSHS